MPTDEDAQNARIRSHLTRGNDLRTTAFDDTQTHDIKNQLTRQQALSPREPIIGQSQFGNLSQPDQLSFQDPLQQQALPQAPVRSGSGIVGLDGRELSSQGPDQNITSLLDNLPLRERELMKEQIVGNVLDQSRTFLDRQYDPDNQQHGQVLSDIAQKLGAVSQLAPDNYSIHQTKAEVLLNLGNEAEARRELDGAFRIYEKLVQPVKETDSGIVLVQDQRAVEMEQVAGAEVISQDREDDIEFLAKQADLYAELKDHRKSLELYDLIERACKQEQIKPEADIKARKGLVLIEAGKLEKGVTALEDSIRDLPRGSELFYNAKKGLMRCYQKLDRTSDAESIRREFRPKDYMKLFDEFANNIILLIEEHLPDVYEASLAKAKKKPKNKKQIDSAFKKWFVNYRTKLHNDFPIIKCGTRDQLELEAQQVYDGLAKHEKFKSKQAVNRAMRQDPKKVYAAVHDDYSRFVIRRSIDDWFENNMNLYDPDEVRIRAAQLKRNKHLFKNFVSRRELKNRIRDYMIQMLSNRLNF